MGYYKIIVENIVDSKRKKDFEGLDFEYLEGTKTMLVGDLKDQSELFSVLNKIRDLNLGLISIMKEN